jgi:hypothetical protein
VDIDGHHGSSSFLDVEKDEEQLHLQEEVDCFSLVFL